MQSEVTQFAAAVAAIERPAPSPRQRPTAARVGVLGEGSLAATLACAALAEGHSVKAASVFSAEWAAGGFELQGGDLTGRYRCEVEPGEDVPAIEAVADVRTAIVDADLVLVVCARPRLATYGALAAGFLTPSQDVVVVGAGVLAALEFRHAVALQGGSVAGVLQTVVDPYLVRRGDAGIQIVAEAERTPVTAAAGVTPLDRSYRLAAAIACPVDILSPAESVFADPSPMLLAAYTIAASGVPEASPNAVAVQQASRRLIERLGSERAQLAALYGQHDIPGLDEWGTLYGAEPLADERSWTALPVLAGWHAMDGELGERARWLLSGAFGPWTSLAHAAGVDVPTFEACSGLLAVFANAPDGLADLSGMGLAGLTPQGILQVLAAEAQP
jgi:hypothetical protein